MQRRTKKLIIVGVIAPVLLLGAAGGAVAVRRYQVSRAVERAGNEGRQLFEQGRYEEALPLLGKYVGRNRGDADAMLMLAQSRANVPKPEGGELAEAARYAEAALVAAPGNEQALRLLLDYYTRLNFITELKRVAETLLKKDEADPAALNAMFRTSVSLGKHDEALTIARRLIDAKPDDADTFRLVLEAETLKGATPKRLAEIASELVASRPANFELRVIQAQTLLAAENVADAVAVLKEASTLTPMRVRALSDFLRLADSFTVLLRIPGSPVEPTDLSALVEPLASRSLSNERLVDSSAVVMTAWHWRAGRLEEARRWLALGKAHSANNPAWEALGHVVRAEGTDATAPTEQADAPFWKDVADGIKFVDSGEVRQGRDRLIAGARKATAILEAALVDPSEADASRAEAFEALTIATLYVADAEQKMGEWRSALRRWTELSNLEQTWTLPLVLSADTLLQNGQPAAAMQAATSATFRRPGAAEALALAEATVAVYEKTGVTDGQERISSILTELASQGFAPIQVKALQARMAIIVRNQAAFDKAVTALNETKPPASSSVLVQVATRARAAGLANWERLLEAVEAAGGTAEAQLVRADLLAERGDLEGALKILRDAASSQSGRQATNFGLREARLLSQSGRTADAVTLLTRISEADADSARVQLEVLNNSAAWTDETLIRSAVDRLRASTGDDGVEWKLADATRLLTFSPEPAKAQESVLNLNAILKDDPENARASMLLAEWMVTLDNKSAAIEHFIRAADSPDAPPSLQLRLINQLRLAGRAEEAERRMDAFAKLTSLPAETLRDRARLLAQMNRLEESQRDWASLTSTGDPTDRLEFANLLISSNRVAEALAPIDQALATPNLPRGTFMQAVGLLIDAGQPDRAFQLLDAREDDIDPALAARNRAELLERAKRFSDAEAVYKVLAEPAGDAEAVAALAGYYLRRSQPELAKRAISTAAARGVTGAALEGINALAVATSAEGPLSEAQQNAVIQSIPAGPTRDLAEATRWFDANPGKRQEFITRLRSITDADPTQLLAWQLMVSTYLDLGQPDEAGRAAGRAAAALPRSWEAAALSATTLFQVGRLDDARTEVRRWRELAPDPLEADVCLARIEAAAGRFSEATAALEPIAALAAQGGNTFPTRALEDIIALYAAIGDVQRARALASLGPATDPDWSATLASIAANSTTPREAAVDWLNQLAPSLSASPNGAIAASEAFAALYRRFGSRADLDTALNHLQPVVASPDASASLLGYAGTLYSQAERESDAEAMYRRAIAKDPSFWAAGNNLAYMLVRRNPPDPQALSLAARAVTDAERANVVPRLMARPMQTLALAQLRAGKNDEALRTIRAAMKLDPNAIEAQVTEAEALFATGDMARARSAAQSLLKRLESDPSLWSAEDRSRLEKLAKTTQTEESR